MHISRRFCAWNIANSHHHSACLQTARTLSKSHFWTVTSWRPTNSIVNTFQRTLINAYVGVVIVASYPGHNTTVRSIFVSHRSLATTCENKLWKFFTTCRQVSTNIQLSVVRTRYCIRSIGKPLRGDKWSSGLPNNFHWNMNGVSKKVREPYLRS